MDEPFDLPVNYRGKELTFTSQLKQYGYIYRIEVDVYGVIVSYERDEERNFRTLVDEDTVAAHRLDVELLKAIGEAIEAIAKYKIKLAVYGIDE